MVAAASIDGVWRAAPPRYSAADACEIAAHTFGVRAAAAQSLGSERDQAFTLRDAAGVDVAVMKISNAAEDVAVLDMEAMAASHAARIDSTLCVAIPRRRPGATASTDGASGGEAGHRAQWRDGEDTHWVRMYDRLPGRSRVDPLALSDAALTAWGETTARLGRALRGFIHPRAIRRVPWDVQYAAESRALLDTVRDRSTRSAVTAVLDRFEQVALPAWPTLRAQVVHGDLTVDNVLVDDAGLITGIIDFGDMSHTALLTDVASVLDSVVSGRTGDEGLRAARLVLDGYQRVTPLEADELRLVVDVWAARAAIGIAIASWRSAAGLEEPAFAERYNQSALALVEQVLSTGWERTARLLGGTELGPDQTHAPTALAERRAAVLGPAMEPLSYADPIELHSASGVWMTDATGRRYLDMYNNVACVGHAHPRVVSAVTRQWRTLNTNLRYLHHAAIELAERLVATGPESLDTVLFVNSGSEANDLAWRLAVHHTGRSGGLCTANAYHGITAATAELSPETLPAHGHARHVERWTPPDTYRGMHLSTEGFVSALGRLTDKGVEPAATILDAILLSDGVYDVEPTYAQELLALTHAAGALWIADEVQGGHGRTGDAMWSYQRLAIEPDFVTLGKPMGNGQPVGAVITRRGLVEQFARDTVFFSTFGGNQVSVVAAHAVLDVLADERVLPRVQVTGAQLRADVRTATVDDERIGDVRGVGLANAIEIVADRESKRPDAPTAEVLADALRAHGVLVGRTGARGNVLKVRPPLAFTDEHIPIFVAALLAALGEVSLPGPQPSAAQ